jgi:Peptidase C39 family
MGDVRPPRKHIGRALVIPYEAQLDGPTNRMCGAAALVMVFKSFGLTADQTQIWQQVRTQAADGTWYAMSDSIGAFALNNGLRAVIARINQPIPVLATSWDNQVRVIINRRLAQDSFLGHFTVVAGITTGAVIEHDPQNGPNLPMPDATLLQLWTANGPCPPCEITGNIMIAFDQPGPTPPAEVCAAHHGQPSALTCESTTCQGKAVPFGIVPAVGCAYQECAQRTWEVVICPWCNAEVTPPSLNP